MRDLVLEMTRLKISMDKANTERRNAIQDGKYYSSKELRELEKGLEDKTLSEVDVKELRRNLEGGIVFDSKNNRYIHMDYETASKALHKITKLEAK